MRRFLILKLQGPLQAWGAHTYEDFRPTMGFPSRSGLLGLLGACLGIERDDSDSLLSLARSVHFAVRVDGRFTHLSDFHTVMDARKVGGKVNPYPVVSRREYLMPVDIGAGFTVAVWEAEEAAEISLRKLVQAIARPVFTPYLGRRSCPLARPLYETEVGAASAADALALIPPVGGVIYSEEGGTELPQLRVRDQPVIVRSRQFASRHVYIHNSLAGNADVSEQS